MKRSANLVVGAITGAALVASMSACGIVGSGDSASGAGGCEAPSANTNDKPLSGKVDGNITFQTQGLKKDFKPFFTKTIKKFEKAHPGVKVKWTDVSGGANFDTQMLTDAQGCNLPDVLNVASTTIEALTNAGTLLNLDKKAPGVGSKFVPKMWKSIELDDTHGHTALPWYWAPFITTYNKKLFKKAGLDPNKPPATVKEYYADAIKIAKNTDGKVKAIWGNTEWSYVDQWHGMGVKAMNADHTKFTFADDPNARAWLSGLLKAYKAGAIPKDSVTGDPDPSQAFTEGNLAFGSPNPSFIRNVKLNAPNIYPHTGVSKGLVNPGTPSMMSAQFLAVPKTSKNATTAVAFAKFLTSSENELAWCKDPNVVIFPTVTKALKNKFFTHPGGNGAFAKARRIAAKEALNSEAYYPLFYMNGSIDTAVVGQFQLALQGKKSAKQALADAQRKANKLLKSSQS